MGVNIKIDTIYTNIHINGPKLVKT